MNAGDVTGHQRTRAHVTPFAVFMGFQLLLVLTGFGFEWEHPAAPWWRHWPSHWIYPLQALVCFMLLLRWRRWYELRWEPGKIALGMLCGALGIAVWLLPTTLYDHLGLTGKPAEWQTWLGLTPRTDKGFNPWVLASPAACWGALLLRFFRAVVVVALVEEIFWRGFIMRLVLDWDGNYWQQPFGRHSWLSYLVVTGLFVGVHEKPDWLAAFVYGSLTYLLCIRTKSLSACVAMHATANFLLGCYVIAYGKYGLW